ncbi:hypothetical protein [Chryseobacterium sp.]|uniref:hypothetical protein n=1 Tax=Chryseobacterium sp. TaxID=1871047 RepID=UPI0028A26890|nr:hypothetical protein [Chryseobacterium sp.]
MSRLTLEQFKTDNKNANDSRLNLDQFKAQISNNQSNEELEKLTGGVLGACHSWWDKTKAYLQECVDEWAGGNPFSTPLNK